MYHTHAPTLVWKQTRKREHLPMTIRALPGARRPLIYELCVSAYLTYIPNIAYCSIYNMLFNIYNAVWDHSAITFFKVDGPLMGGKYISTSCLFVLFYAL